MIELFLLPAGIPEKCDRDRPVVILDIYRASTSIASALAAGAAGVHVAGSMEEAAELKHRLGDMALLAGERGGLKIEGYDLGNSPREMTPEKVNGHPVIFNSTNGTKLLRRFGEFPQVAVGSFVCLSATVAWCRQFEQDPILCCAGQLGRFSTEDTLAAARIISHLDRNDDELDDAALFTARLLDLAGDRWYDWAKHSSHGQTLTGLGLGADLDVCLLSDTYDFVPVKSGEVIVCDNGDQ